MRRDTRLLLTGALGAALAANALRPVRRTGPLSVAAFAVGMPVAELPRRMLLGSGLIVAHDAWRGGMRTGRGRLGTALSAAAGVALLRAHRIATGTGQVLELALIDGLGGGYRDRITGERPDAPYRRRRRSHYRVARNVSYGDHGKHNTLDVWRRPGLRTDAKAPVLLQIHGGGWVSGRKEGQAEPLMRHLAECGWVCVTANYRLSPKADWPDHLVDVKRALAWVQTHIAEYGGDPDFIVVTGGSAGGQLAALVALDDDTDVAAAVTFYGVYDFLNRYGTGRDDMASWLSRWVFKSSPETDRARWDQASPIGCVTPDAPPFFVLHGSNDSLFHVEQAREFARDLSAVSANPVVYAELPGAQHAFDMFPSVRMQHTVRAVERFLDSVRSRHR